MKWQVLGATLFGWVVLAQFRDRHDASAYFHKIVSRGRDAKLEAL